MVAYAYHPGLVCVESLQILSTKCILCKMRATVKIVKSFHLIGSILGMVLYKCSKLQDLGIDGSHRNLLGKGWVAKGLNSALKSPLNIIVPAPNG